ncbi:hypothetical protein EDF64_11177 [Curtobacterium flaccumfaciens]|uniref:Uncharacterized protein n=1 Tax=Curtobacterium flaccumfaciens TaxID=2035 RepID=A0A4R6DDU8_9MICO|nr:hypothetical protein EDF64_11177 [Curtobacterium flaccumfaciens]
MTAVVSTDGVRAIRRTTSSSVRERAGRSARRRTTATPTRSPTIASRTAMSDGARSAMLGPVTSVSVATAASPTTAAITATAWTTAPARDRVRGSVTRRSRSTSGTRDARALATTRATSDPANAAARARRTGARSGSRAGAPAPSSTGAQSAARPRPAAAPATAPTTVASTGSSRTAANRRRAGSPRSRASPHSAARACPMRPATTPWANHASTTACSAGTATIVVAASFPSATRSTRSSIRSCTDTDDCALLSVSVPSRAAATSRTTAGTSSRRSPCRRVLTDHIVPVIDRSSNPARDITRSGPPVPPLPNSLPGALAIRPTRLVAL